MFELGADHMEPIRYLFLAPLLPNLHIPSIISTHTHTVPLKQNREVEINEKEPSLTQLTQSLLMTGHLGGHCSWLPVFLWGSKRWLFTLRWRPRQALPPTSFDSLLVFLKSRASCLPRVWVVITLCLFCCLQIIFPTFRAIASYFLSLLWSSTGRKGPVSWLSYFCFWC